MFNRGTIDGRQCRDSKKEWPNLSVNKRTACVAQIHLTPPKICEKISTNRNSITSHYRVTVSQPH